MSQEVVTDVIINYESQNLDQTVGGIKQTSVALDGLVVASSSTEKSTAALANRFAALEKQYGTTSGNAAQFAKVQKAVTDAVGQNSDLQARGNDVLEAARLKYLATGAAVAEAAKAHEGFSTQGQAAFHAARGFTEQLLVGIPVTQAAASEINHLTYAATGPGGLSGAFKEVASLGGRLFSSLLSPTTLIVGGLAAATAGALALANSYDKAAVSSQRAIGGAGARTGTSPGDLNQFAKSNSSPLGLSLDEARGLGEALTQTGDITVSQLHNMNEAVVGFANQTKTSVSDAIKEFEKFGSDPVKALDALEKEFGPVDEHIKNLVAFQSLAADKTQAFNTVIDTLSKSLKDAADNTTLLEKGQRLLATSLGGFGAPAKDPGTQLAAIDKQLAQGQSGISTAGLQDQRADLLNKISADSVRQVTAEVNALNSAEGRAAEQTSAIAKSWGDVSIPVALVLNTMQQQLALAQAITGQEQQAAQFGADRANALLQGKTELEAQELASSKLAVSQASATTAVEKQVDALKDSTALIKAQQNGTEAATAAAIAYRDAIESGADETSAAALKAATLANNVARAAQNAESLAASMRAAAAAASIGSPTPGATGVGAFQNISEQQSIGVLNAQVQAGAEARGSSATSQTDPLNLQGTGGDAYRINLQNLVGTAYTQGGLAGALAALKAAPDATGATDFIKSVAGSRGYDATAIFGPEQSLVGGKVSILDQIAQAQKLGPADEINLLQSTLPSSIERDQKIADLTAAMLGLTSSTDNLNQTNQDLLSPYYTQDPRTSHIGFRTQGMASGGDFVVPGGYSANDNMLGTIPLASGEIVSVRRPGQDAGSSKPVYITNNITVGSGANVDQFKRTMFQSTQNTVRQIRAAS